MTNKKANSKKSVALIVLASLLTLTIICGSVAWLTTADSVTNTFTVGNISEPTTDPEDPTHPDDPSVTGNIHEPNWDENNAKLLPGIEIVKDPYVGIGKGSEESVVYVYVENDFTNKVYFTLNSGWSAVDGEATAGSTAGTYTGGLFKYDTNLVATETDDAWTATPIFSKVVVDETADSVDLVGDTIDNTKDIVVSCFIHQAKNAAGEAIDAATIEAAAKAALVPAP